MRDRFAINFIQNFLHFIAFLANINMKFIERFRFRLWGILFCVVSTKWVISLHNFSLFLPWDRLMNDDNDDHFNYFNYTNSLFKLPLGVSSGTCLRERRVCVYVCKQICQSIPAKRFLSCLPLVFSIPEKQFFLLKFNSLQTHPKKVREGFFIFHSESAFHHAIFPYRSKKFHFWRWEIF